MPRHLGTRTRRLKSLFEVKVKTGMLVSAFSGSAAPVAIVIKINAAFSLDFLLRIASVESV